MDSIITNYADSGFACEKRCNYCEWKNNPLIYLPYKEDELENYIKDSNQDTIYITGGGDPLFEYGNSSQLNKLVRAIKYHNKKVVVETREVKKIRDLFHNVKVDQFHVSLDAEVLSELSALKLDNMDIKYSLVVPMLPTKKLNEIINQYSELRKNIKGTLILKENLNSVFNINKDELVLDHKIQFKSKADQITGNVFINKKFSKSEIYLDHALLYNHLTRCDDVFIFGSIVNHILLPSRFTNYNDIDMVVTKRETIDDIISKFNYKIIEVERSAENTNPVYYKLYSSKLAKMLHIVRVENREQAEAFINNAQLDINRLYTNKGELFSYLPLNVLKSRLADKIANIVPPSVPSLFRANRRYVELMHNKKMLRRGFTINGLMPETYDF